MVAVYLLILYGFINQSCFNACTEGGKREKNNEVMV